MWTQEKRGFEVHCIYSLPTKGKLRKLNRPKSTKHEQRTIYTVNKLVTQGVFNKAEPGCIYRHLADLSRVKRQQILYHEARFSRFNIPQRPFMVRFVSLISHLTQMPRVV